MIGIFYTCSIYFIHYELCFSFVKGTEITAVFQNGSTVSRIGRDVPDNSKAKWTKNGKSLHSKNLPFYRFGKISPRDEGLYVCTFEQDNIQLELKYHVIVVDYQETVFVKMGDNIEFGKTVPDEYMSANATWTSPKNLKTSHLEPTKYLIENVSSADIGLYTCEFGPPKYRSKIRYELTETGTEKVFLRRRNDSVDFGIYIEPTDISAHAYKWTKNGREFESESSLVKIRYVSLEDEGLYVCTYGSKNMQSKYHLIVTGK
ncbi:Hypothetical predicted protein [Mytilus galloprovincialis]|uniref:Immunoglobulin domain-containing protein n=1 Tax=Mytilus galloprovincialis TaxID=29158 RepID=A0A8B6HQ98_MYTGA|nr:Hypothetical predicted protein [Mytilus galloprovincialis]